MKTTLLLCLLGYTCLSQPHYETPKPTFHSRPLPFSHKAWLVGLQVGYSKGNYGQERYTATQVYGGYFVANKLLVGLAATWGRESFGAAQDVAVSGGPTLRYQVTRTRLSPFIVGAYQFGQATVSGLKPTPGTSSLTDQSRFIHSRYVGVGLSAGILANSRLDLALTWQDKPGATELGFQGNYNLLQAQIGINYGFTNGR